MGGPRKGQGGPLAAAMDRAEGKRERGRTGRPRPRERGKPSGRARGKPGRQGARGKPEPPSEGKPEPRTGAARPAGASGKPLRTTAAASGPPWPLPVLFVGRAVCYRCNHGFTAFSFGREKRGKQFSLPLAPGLCVIEKVYTHTSRALNQTALGLLPSIALSSVG